VQFRFGLYCTLVTSPPSSLFLNPLLAPLKTIAGGFFVLFHIGMWSPSTIYPHHHSPFLFPLVLHTHTVPILQSCLSLLIFKLMFKGVSQCMPTVCTLYFGPFNPFHNSSLPLLFPPPIFQQLSMYILILYLHILCYVILLTLSHSLLFSLFPQVP
jgi:hypothetical protein